MEQIPNNNQHESNIFQLTQFDGLLRRLLVARMARNSEKHVAATVNANKTYLESSEFAVWLQNQYKLMIYGWLMRLKSNQLEEKGQLIVQSLLNKDQIFTITTLNTNQDQFDDGWDFHFARFMGEFALGFLHQHKTITFEQLGRSEVVADSGKLMTQESFWMFNWTHEEVHTQLRWLQRTAYWIKNAPEDLINKYPHQFLKFAHSVSAMLVVTQHRATELKRSFTRKQKAERIDHKNKWRAAKTEVPMFFDDKTKMLTSDTKVDDGSDKISYKSGRDARDNGKLPSKEFDGEVPDNFADYIQGLDF